VSTAFCLGWRCTEKDMSFVAIEIKCFGSSGQGIGHVWKKLSVIYGTRKK